MTFVHQPVLLKEALSYLACQSGGMYIDCTLGGAGHAVAILDQSAPSGCLLGIDQDRAALSAAAKRLEPYGERVHLIKGIFANWTSYGTLPVWQHRNFVRFRRIISAIG